ncbi:ABC transporter permease [Hominifimenecus sp. rT4P-3]|uniref:ABC transporter permease n=1 Tax=Hominifimenecus sp. rT4P-3 TaxID=3242979 RepID=UPI003DA25FE7
MGKYIIKRLFMALGVLLGVSLLIFILLDLAPGDPARQILGETATAEAVENLREEMGLNRPLVVRWGEYLRDIVLHGDFGTSYKSNEPVAKEILTRFVTTINFALVVFCLTLLVGIPLGIISAIRRGTWADTVLTSIAMIFMAVPGFWLGLMLILVLACKLAILPVSGWYGPVYWIMPCVTHGAFQIASLMKTTRASMLDVTRQDYISTARAKGLREKRVVYHHMLKNALIPVITNLGTMLGHLLGGAMVIEQIFAVPGLGKFLIESLGNRDFPVVQGGVLLISAVYSVMILLTDILYTVVDPRLRSMYTSKKKSVKKGA